MWRHFLRADRLLAMESLAWAGGLSILPTPLVAPGLVFLIAWLAWLARTAHVLRAQRLLGALVWLTVFTGGVGTALLAPVKTSDTVFYFGTPSRFDISELRAHLEAQGFRVLITRGLPAARVSLPSARVSFRALRERLNRAGIDIEFCGRCGNATEWSILLGTRTDSPNTLALFPARPLRRHLQHDLVSQSRAPQLAKEPNT